MITPPTQTLATRIKKTPAVIKKTPAATTKKAKACRVSQTAQMFTIGAAQPGSNPAMRPGPVQEARARLEEQIRKERERD